MQSNKLNQRLNIVEEKVESIGFEIGKLNDDNTATVIQLNDLKTNISNTDLQILKNFLLF